MTRYNQHYLHRLSVLASAIMLASCSLTSSDLNTADKPKVTEGTLGSLVSESLVNKEIVNKSLANTEQNNVNVQLLTRQQRSDKLAKIYRSILTLEPNTQVRAQIQHRMVQLNIAKHEESETLENKAVLAQLVTQYQHLLSTYPDRPENEDIQYQLAKTYDLLGKPKQSILTLEALLKRYPETKHYAELQFRRAELYYNLQQYPLAYQAYQAVLVADNNDNYRLNSLYMSGWSLFKLNRLPEADDKFITVLNDIVAANVANAEDKQHFSFNNVSLSHQSLAKDTQRVLSISLSQQQQAKSLVELLNRQQSNLALADTFEHVLFQNLAHFLLEKELEHDAVLTYQSYLAYSPHSLWAAKFSLALIDLHQQKNQFAKIKTLKERFVDYYGLTSTFWQQENKESKRYALPHLLTFSLAKSRSLYAHAQGLENNDERVPAFAETATWLKKYLDIVAFNNTLLAQNESINEDKSEGENGGKHDIQPIKNLRSQQPNITGKLPTHIAGDLPNLATQEYFLYAEANYEAQQYKKALAVYKMLAYSPLYIEQNEPQKTAHHYANINNKMAENGNAVIDDSAQDMLPLAHIRKESAYATIVTMQSLLAPFIATVTDKKAKPLTSENETTYQHLLADRQQLNDLFIEHYSDDRRAALIAVKAAEYAFEQNNSEDVIRYSNFVLNTYHIDALASNNSNTGTSAETAFKLEKAKLDNTQLDRTKLGNTQLDSIALKQVAIVSQLKANTRYKLKQYAQAEQDYLLALNFVNDKSQQHTLNELVASSIYEQAKAEKDKGTTLANTAAIKHFLRLGKAVPQSTYRANAEFDAANLLLADKKWSRAITVLTQFQQQFPAHQYTSTIPAKLALSYEQLENWSQAAKQLLVIVANTNDTHEKGANNKSTNENRELKRESQYTAAEYYLKAGDLTNAIINFRTYAHQYPEPFSVAQEVRFKMSEFYRETQEPNKRYFWYRKLISFHQKQMKKQPSNNERSTYLASYAAFNLGQAHQQTFNYTKLKVPLNKSLKRKQAAMKQAIKYYQLVFEWQLAEFVPQANYSIGQIYRDLANDVMTSERPKGLDELALEEYEFVLEEIAYPFEEKAIEVHQANAERAWSNIYDQWVKESLAVLAEIDPAKYNKYETVPEVFDAIF